MMRDVVAIHNIFSHLLILLHNYCIALPLESLSVYGTKSIRNVSTSLFPKSSKHAKVPMPSVPFMVNIITFVLPLVLAIFFTQHTVWKSINGVVAYSNSNTGDICAYFKKRNVSDERKYSLVVSLRTPDQEKLEHRWSCRKKFNRNSVLYTRNHKKPK